MNFNPIMMLDELDALDEADIVSGHLSAVRGDPEPGANRGRAFWHGWRTRMMDLREIEVDPEHRELVRQFVERQRDQQQT